MLGTLEAMPSNKQYAELEDSVNKAVQFIRYPGHCLKDGPRLLALLANLLYPDLRYLHIIRWLWTYLLPESKQLFPRVKNPERAQKF